MHLTPTAEATTQVHLSQVKHTDECWWMILFQGSTRIASNNSANLPLFVLMRPFQDGTHLAAVGSMLDCHAVSPLTGNPKINVKYKTAAVLNQASC